MGIDRPDWGDGSGKSSGVVVPDSSSPVPTEKHADWGDGERTSYLVEQTPEYLPAGAGEDLDPALVERRGKEGGVERNLAQARAAAEDIMGRTEDGDTLMFKFDNQLPQSIQNKIFDALRISPAKGRGQAAIKAFEDSLDDREIAIWAEWVDGLYPDERAAIIAYLNGETKK
jgi:hypothetical protein